MELQDVAYELPEALTEFDEKKGNDVFTPLVEKLTNHFSPERNSTFERHVFRHITLREGEKFNEFEVRLRKQLKSCDFGTTRTEIEDICLKDRIIDAWAPTKPKCRLLEKERTLEEVIKACKAEESTNEQLKLMTATNPKITPNLINTNDPTRDTVNRV